MNRKYFLRAVVAITFVVLVVWGAIALSSPTKLPSGVSTTTPSVTSVKPKSKPPTVTTSPTTTETVTTISPPPPTTTPTVVPGGCEQNGLNTADWNTDDDNTDRNGFTMADGKVAALAPTSGDCYDTVVLTVYDDLRDNVVVNPDLAEDDPIRYAWTTFLSGYIADGELLMHDPVGSVVPMNSPVVLQLTVLADAFPAELLPLVHPGTPSSGVPPVYRFDADNNFVSLHEIVWAGSFERTTTFGIGVNGKTPFAVDYGRVTMDVTEIILHVAHQ